jgi:hypothetical protein
MPKKKTKQLMLIKLARRKRNMLVELTSCYAHPRGCGETRSSIFIPDKDFLYHHCLAKEAKANVKGKK